MLVLAVRKPDPVPILPAEGVAKSRTSPEFPERRRVRLRTASARRSVLWLPAADKTGGDNLSGPSITLGLERALSPKATTTLALGKDFAVSPSSSDEAHPEGCPRLSLRASLLAPLCLRTTAVSRCLCPLARASGRVSGLSSPHLAIRSSRLDDQLFYYTIIYKLVNERENSSGESGAGSKKPCAHKARSSPQTSGHRPRRLSALLCPS